MPNPQGEEFRLGRCFNQHDYDPDYEGPSWDELLTLLAKEKINRMGILFCGKAGSGGKVGATGFGIVDRRSVQRVPLDVWDVSKERLTDLTRNPDNTPMFAKMLLGLNERPIHITGIIVRKQS